MTSPDLSRRNMLKLGAGALAVAATGAPVLAEDKKKIPIGLQVYSVRNAAGKDIAGTLAGIGKIGYKGVEFAGYYGKKAEDLKKMLDDAGLQCCGTHTGWGSVVGDALKATIEFNKIIGNKYLIVPGGLPKDKLKTAAGLQEIAKILSESAAKAKEAGMFVGYHAHGGDFAKVEGKPEWEHLFDAGPTLVHQMDVGNCLGGGGDPVAYIKKYPGQTKTIHLKEHGATFIGEGKVKWNEVFDACETVGGTEWYIVEEESKPDALDNVAKDFEILKKLGKV